MGGTASRPEPEPEPVKCDVMPVPGYSKLVRAPHRLTLAKLFFGGVFWEVYVKATSFDQDGLADHLLVSVVIDRGRGLRSVAGTLAGTHISIEILDETREHTVFREESSQGTLEETYGHFILCVKRRELEASSCVFADSFTVRCTMKKMQRATKQQRLLGKLLRSNAVLAPQVAMAGSHALTIGSVSKLRAALRNAECIRSTHFAVGGSRWYLKFCPRWNSVDLVHVSNGDETPPATAEFSFELEGAVNFKSQTMRHTFDHDDDQHVRFRYKLEQNNTSPMHGDRLVVRCHLAVIMPDEKPTAVPAGTESMLTPLLSAMHG